MIWSTEILEFIKANNLGMNLFTHSPYFQLNENMKKGGLKYKITNEEYSNISSINNDILNLVKYIKIGDKELILRDYQNELLKSYKNNKFNLVLNSRQTGITLVNAIFILNYILTKRDRNVVIITNKRMNGIELLDKIKDLYYSLPFYMKPGVSTWNQSSISFDNNVRISISTDLTSLGFGINCLIVQDAAFIEKLTDLYRSLFPSISALKDCNIIMNSCSNGMNLFYDLVQNAESHKNNYNLTKVYWWQVEGRDEKWKNEQINIIGKDAFDREYDLKFIDNVENKSMDLLLEIEDLIKELKVNLSPKLVSKLGKLQKKLKDNINI